MASMINTPTTEKLTASSPVKGGPRKHEFQPDIYDILTQRLRFRPVLFFAGFALGLVACVIGGRYCAGLNVYKNFHRFHKFISPAALFYPTVSQLRAIATSGSTPSQVLVIVGGNSIFNGYGQPEQELWTTNLQGLLGSNYKVINFALPIAEPFDFGYWAAESLLKENRRVIYVTNCFPGQGTTPSGSQVYTYSYWDAKEKHLLMPDAARDRAVIDRIKPLPEKDRVKSEELQTGANLDGFLWFQDLWTTVSYKGFFSVWTGLTSKSPWLARQRYSDIKTEPMLAPDRFTSPSQLKQIFEFNREFFVENSSASHPQFWTNFQNQIQYTVPTSVRKNCLVTLSSHAPAIVDQMSPLRKEQERVGIACSEAAWRNAGFNCIDVEGKLTSDDFSDGRHLLASGGRKLAAVLAPQVKQLAHSLKYD
ncbi:MAG TPA: hypothetical protein V6C97_32195 [Oculatellaceae cyanobacterium]